MKSELKLKRRSTQEWIDERFIPTHGDLYDYSSIVHSDWSKKSDKIIIICRVHGEFNQTNNNHATGTGCPHCFKEKNSVNSNERNNAYFSLAKEVHGDVYDYSATEYTGDTVKLSIICHKKDINGVEHGAFIKKAGAHTTGKQGCTKCGIERKKQKLSYTLKQSIDIANNKHCYKYDYSHITEYDNSHTKVDINCPIHGLFGVKWYIHTQGSGCPSCYPSSSEIELKLLNELKNNTKLNIKHQFWINNREIDILINNKIGVEVNGMYWHSDQQKENDYHIHKSDLAEKEGIHLIHINEQELIMNFDKCISLIKAKVGKFDSVIYARKCSIKEVSYQDADKFLTENHMQGSRSVGSTRYGLYYNDILVSIMTFGKPRFNQEYDWEMIRFCSSLNTQIIGGASKLLKYFRKINSGSIISYANRRWSIGTLYEKLGFTMSHKTEPNYEWTSPKATYSRYQTQKHKLNDLLGDKFNPNKSEYENMRESGFFKVFDSGNIVYVLEDD